MKKFLKHLFILMSIGLIILYFVKIFFLNHDYQVKKYNEANYEKGVVITFHGIYGTEKQLRAINENLANRGCYVVNIQYPTLEDNIPDMTEKYIKPVIDEELKKLENINLERKKQGLPELKINFIAHSMGTCLLRYYLKENEIKNLGKVILISPPSHGSQLSDNPLTNILKYFLGKAPIDLKTDKDSFVNSLEEPNYKTYILIGNKSNNFLYSLFIKGIDDGMVPLDGANLKDADFEIIDATTHTSILKDERTLDKINKILKQ